MFRSASNRLGRSLSFAPARLLSLRPEPCQTEDLRQIGAGRIWSEEHDAFRETARRFFAEKVVPFHSEWEAQGECPKQLWKEAGETGLLGVTMPEEVGGVGADVLYSAVVWEEQSFTGCTGPGFALHSEIVLPYLLHYGTKEQQERFIPPMIAGELIGAIAMTEPGAGSDLQGVRTTIVPDGDDFILTPEKGAHGISLVIVEDGMKGFTKGKKLKKLGLRAQDTSELFFEDVRIPKSSILGEPNKGFYYLMQELPQERLLIADMAQAAAEACFEWTREYVKDRKVRSHVAACVTHTQAFGKTIADLQVTKHKLAEVKCDLAVGRSFIDRCLELHQAKQLDSVMASMAKMHCSELQNRVGNTCLQLHGGWGYMWDMPVCRHFADARVQSIYGGTNEIMKELIARSL